MNKQELIGTLRKLLTKPSEGTDFDYGHDYGIQRAIYLAEDLDEQQAPINKPKKPVVPQFVADWVANSREYDYEFCDFFDCNYQSEEVYRWLKCENRRQSELNSLALSMLVVHGRDAVIVEEEKLYRAKNRHTGEYLCYCFEFFHDKNSSSENQRFTAEEKRWKELGYWNNDLYAFEEVEGEDE